MAELEPESLILLSHGGGGQKTIELIEQLILRHFRNPILEKLDDSACLDLSPQSRLAFTTDSYVVTPLFFPGSNIGHLAACGTINDLVMQGAQPLYLSLGLILEEGLRITDLDKILQSLAEVTQQTGVSVVTGDTKVVERGHGHGVFINTSGIGVRLPQVDVHLSQARPDDRIILTGSLGDHGIVILSQRHQLHLPAQLTSDAAPLWDLLRPVLENIPNIHTLHDPTRGGLAAALCDIAQASDVGIRIQEASLPIKPAVRAACNILGLDPLHIANEGKAIVILPPDKAETALQILKRHPLGQAAQIIGTVTEYPRALVVLQTYLGGERIVVRPSGEDLPRIC